jgi:hypothetical protein
MAGAKTTPKAKTAEVIAADVERLIAEAEGRLQLLRNLLDALRGK